MIRRLLRQDLVWAGGILLLAAALGVGLQWQLVRLSWTGALPGLLEQQREQRRQVEFQGVKTLNLAQAYEIFQKGQALFVDARNPEEFAELHIAGAVNLSRERLDQEGARALAGIPVDREMVVYCGMVSCDAALKTAEKLQTMGYSRVLVFMGGFRAWDDAGYPADTTSK
jgi:rhodanese-related sulfurtransferase